MYSYETLVNFQRTVQHYISESITLQIKVRADSNLQIITLFFFFGATVPIWAVATSMKLSVSLRFSRT
jgi:hypothetical protein